MLQVLQYLLSFWLMHFSANVALSGGRLYWATDREINHCLELSPNRKAIAYGLTLYGIYG
jgi:hypothetical protein